MNTCTQCIACGKLWVGGPRCWFSRLTNGQSWKARDCSTHTRHFLIIYANATVFVCNALFGVARCMLHGTPCSAPN